MRLCGPECRRSASSRNLSQCGDNFVSDYIPKTPLKVSPNDETTTVRAMGSPVTGRHWQNPFRKWPDNDTQEFSCSRAPVTSPLITSRKWETITSNYVAIFVVSIPNLIHKFILRIKRISIFGQIIWAKASLN